MTPHPGGPDAPQDRPDIRLITVDMDGTLLDPDHRLPASLTGLLAQLRERGVLFCPASGRQYANLAARFADVADDLAFIAENGSLVVLRGEVVSTATIGRDVTADLVRTVRTLAGSGVPVGAVVCGARSAYVEDLDPRFLAEADQYYTLLERVDDLLAVDDDVLKVAVFDVGSAARTTAPTLERFATTHQVVVSGEHWVDVMHPQVHKGAAVQTLQHRLGITRGQTMAFGDYLNDLQMLDAAEHSYAMSNAHPDVLRRARSVAPSNAEDGVVRTVRAVLGLEPAPAPAGPSAR